ncbi:hypothetical protein AB0H60_15330 [Nocardia rhamnosiphila]|uniref:hypothetical protein n=1 Tax=Nocardia rhamnosiphila TaxID=426716 RepID=UPI0033E34B22
MLDTDNARAGLDRALSHVPDGERIISLTIDEDHVGLATIDRNGQYFSSTAEITGEVEAPDLGHTLRIGTRHRSDRRHRFPSCRTGKPLSTTTQGGRRPRFMVCM